MPVLDRNNNPGDTGSDDLPRTLRREREAQQRAQHQKMSQPSQPFSPPREATWTHDQIAAPAIVTAIKVPFFRLMLFYIKAVIAAIPAIILLVAILWGLGHLLMMYFPWLVKIQILIRVPT